MGYSDEEGDKSVTKSPAKSVSWYPVYGWVDVQ